MTSTTGDHHDRVVEEVCEPGVSTGWALRIDEVRPDDPEYEARSGTATRAYAATPLDVERTIADRVEQCGDSIARITYTVGGRDVHLRDGSRIEFRWTPVVFDWRCADCGVDTDAIDEYYMVVDPVWDQATGGLVGGHLCIGCLERRLGRPLRASDFSARPVNTTTNIARSPRLQARLRADTDH